MAYILGFLYADGNIVETKRGTHFIAVYTADEALLRQMQKSLGSNHKISYRSTTILGGVYRLQIGSREWFVDLCKIGLTPNKTKRMVLPKIPKQYIGSFIRGYFDGDGNVWMGEINKKRATPTKVLQLVFTSGSHQYLRDLKSQIQALGVVGGSVYASGKGNYSRLIFSTKDALKLYKIMYNVDHRLFLKRKKVIFERFVRSCGRSSTG